MKVSVEVIGIGKGAMSALVAGVRRRIGERARAMGVANTQEVARDQAPASRREGGISEERR